MEPLLVLEDPRTRQATPTEIYRAAEGLCDRRFPQPFMLSGSRDVGLFARWCLAPIGKPCFLFAVTDGGNHVLRYEVFPCADAELILALATNAAAPAEPSARVWIVAAQPGAPDSRGVDVFGKQLREQIARHRCKNVRYLTVQADRLPDGPSARTKGKPSSFWIQQRSGTYRRATAQETVATAYALSARSLERGQIIAMWYHASAPIHLCAAPLDKPAIAALLLDEHFRFIHFQPICQGSLRSALSHFDAFEKHAREWNASVAVLVCAQTGRLVALTPDELTVLGQLSLAAEKRFRLKLRTHAVVGLDGMLFYHTELPRAECHDSMGSESESVAAERSYFGEANPSGVRLPRSPFPR